MKIVYVAPRFHTNQVPIVKGWLEHGHQVSFISQYKGKTENYSYCEPCIMGYSKIFKIFLSVYTFLSKTSKRFSSYPEVFQSKFGFPPLFRLYRYLKKTKPDLVILRERSVYSIVTYLLCRICRSYGILYNQTPLWDYEPPRNDPAHRIIKALTPPVRITPVLGNPAAGYRDDHAVYIPFVIEPQLAPTEKKYFCNQQINLLCVGKFEDRKHHMMLLKILRGLLPEYPLHLTLVGEVSTLYHENYYQKIQDYITMHHLEPFVSCHTNCSPDEMPVFYRAADLFILPSTGEFASISQLEAMSYSLPVIVSDTNGTSCYVEEGVNGYLFQDKNIEDLKAKISEIITDKSNIPNMGAHSYQLVLEKYSFTNYQHEIEKLIPS